MHTRAGQGWKNNKLTYPLFLLVYYDRTHGYSYKRYFSTPGTSYNRIIGTTWGTFLDLLVRRIADRWYNTNRIVNPYDHTNGMTIGIAIGMRKFSI